MLLSVRSKFTIEQPEEEKVDTADIDIILEAVAKARPLINDLLENSGSKGVEIGFVIGEQSEPFVQLIGSGTKSPEMYELIHASVLERLYSAAQDASFTPCNQDPWSVETDTGVVWNRINHKPFIVAACGAEEPEDTFIAWFVYGLIVKIHLGEKLVKEEKAKKTYKTFIPLIRHGESEYKK